MSHLEQAIEKLASENIRLTPQRLAILKVLAYAKTHPTAEMIYREIAIDFPGMSVATVYNNLKRFTEIGLIREMNYGDASSRFDFCTEPHYHVICSRCGKVTDFHYPHLDDVEMAAGQLTNYKIQSHRLEIYGLCSNCQKENV